MKAVIFDMDGVIIDSQSIADKLITETAEKFGVRFTEKELHDLHGISFPDFWQYVKEKNNLPESAEFYSSQYDVQEEIRRYEGLLPINGIPELIEDIKKHGVKVAVATSATRERMQKVLDLFNMNKTFDALVCADDVIHAKPDPEIFLNAAKKLTSKPQDCIVIEDAVNGYLAAKSAGMKCILYWTKKTPLRSSVTASLIIDDFSKINFEALEKL